MTTHYLDEAEYCDRLALIYRGRIIAEGRPDVMKKEHMEKDVLEVSVTAVVEALDVLGERGFDAALFGNVIHATVDDAATAIPVVRSSLESAGIAVLDVTVVPPSLEDVFVSLIEAFS